MNRKDEILEVHERFRQFGRHLNEFQRRLWAATEALKLGRGGIAIVSKALRISPNTIRRGIKEIAEGQTDTSPHAMVRIRKPGGGRKSKKPSENQPAPVRPPDALDTAGGRPSPDAPNGTRHETPPVSTDPGSTPAPTSVPAQELNSAGLE